MSDPVIAPAIRDRLKSDLIGWLTTVQESGQPQTSPVWFLWDEESSRICLISQPNTRKIRNIATNSRVAFHLNDDGAGHNIVTLEATASLGPAISGALFHSYFDKYASLVQNLGQRYAEEVGQPIAAEIRRVTPKDIVRDFSTTIQLKPTSVRAW